MTGRRGVPERGQVGCQPLDALSPALRTGYPDGRRDQDGSRVPLLIRSTEEEPDSVPAASPRLAPQHFTVVSRPVDEYGPGVPNTRKLLRRTALGPDPPGSSRFKVERRKRRFLAYSFPSRSPDPHHLAVLARSDFVGAAYHPLRHHTGRAAPSSTVLLRQDRRRRSLTSTQINSTSRRTHRSLKTSPPNHDWMGDHCAGLGRDQVPLYKRGHVGASDRDPTQGVDDLLATGAGSNPSSTRGPNNCAFSEQST